jgi:uncharacterized membrane protein
MFAMLTLVTATFVIVVFVIARLGRKHPPPPPGAWTNGVQGPPKAR